MKRLLVLAVLLGSLVLPGTVLGFHHTGLPARFCAAEAAGSPSNDNGMAKESLIAHNPAQALPLPPVGTPGDGQGEGAEFCANAD
jgi:hypothetical protein